MRCEASVQHRGLPKLECQRVGIEANGPAWVEFGKTQLAQIAR